MLEFKTTQTLKPNDEILKAIKDYTYKVKKGTIKHILHTNLQELVKKLNCTEENDNLIFTNIKNIGFIFLYDLLTREAKRDMIHRLISQIEITRDSNYNIDIKNIKFTDEFITKSSKSYLKYLNEIMINDNIGIKYQEEIDEEKLKKIELDYDILSIKKIKNNEYSNEFIEDFISKSREHFYVDGIISYQYIEGNTIKDILILVPKKDVAIVIKERNGEIKK